ncbi:hypothetical protein CcaverHIS002_0212100 [Cutaneotrichosporon cavernicola]|uniref:Uncharacterized protein n=1 Tax=Cutaneotrichosporon cavernicola TaxID=279322 RepID=A0AA48I568_9TREE|nr:uncharacterized protein CcaverHIS019_0212110 [Cutaneotrichosporon cavernicola]BEI82050.1 hypothetical protein CcaverHIS002_0212100 [Cutaneotrichosporon cavernicola]BEI89849.1 hypothetical protein CcaverHIS019_0212110 [Cutaneotrichosporon cavernicola]
MRSTLLVVAVAALPAVLSAPIADVGVARHESALAAREDDSVAVEARQIPGFPFPIPGFPSPGASGGPGFGDFGAIITQLLSSIPFMPKDFVKTMVDLMTGVLGGKPLDPKGIAKIQTAPTSVMKDTVKMFKTLIAGIPFFGPIFAPFLGILEVFAQMGSSLIPSARDIDDRQIPGLPSLPLPMGDITKQFADAMALVGIGADVAKVFMDLFTSMLSGKPLDPSKMIKAFSQGPKILAKVASVMTNIVKGIPGIGPIFAPFLSGLTLAATLAGAMGGSLAGVAGGLD